MSWSCNGGKSTNMKNGQSYIKVKDVKVGSELKSSDTQKVRDLKVVKNKNIIF